MLSAKQIPLSLLVALALPVTGCGGTPGDDVADTTSALSGDTCSPSLAAGAVSSYEKDLLNLVATTEGTYHHDANDGYDVTYAYHTLSSCVHDTDVVICSGGYCSMAQGRYQFLYTTYHGLGLPSFEPNHQDIGAVMLVHQSGSSGEAVPSSRALDYGEFVGVMDDISYQWASLPPGRYGQPSVSMGEAWSIYSGFVGKSGSGGSTGGSCELDGHKYGTNTCTETKQCDDGSWVARTSDASSCNTGIEPGGGCITDSGSVVSQNTCTSTLQCDDGVWVDRSGDPSACNGGSSMSCNLAGHTYGQNTCTDTLQCRDGSWVERTSDPSACDKGVEPSGKCITDTGAVVVENTCTSTLQCDDGVWVDRYDDPTACR